MIKQERNKNSSLQEMITYLVQSKPQAICSSVECQAMSPTNLFDIDSLQQFHLVRFCRKFFMDSGNLKALDASTVNICGTICAHDYSSPTFVILIGLCDVNENPLLKYIPTNNSRMQYFEELLRRRFFFIKCESSCASRWNFWTG